MVDLRGSNRWPPECKSGALPAELKALTKGNGGPEWIRVYWRPHPIGCALTSWLLAHQILKTKLHWEDTCPAAADIKTVTSLEKRWIQPLLPKTATLLRLPSHHLPWLAASLRLAHYLRAKPTPHDLTGGVYKTRERIHRSVLIYGLLAIQLHALELQSTIELRWLLGLAGLATLDPLSPPL